MTAPVIAFLNNKGGVGKTSLVFHVGWMASELGLRVLVADLDPQANLTAAFLTESQLEDLWPIEGYGATVYGAVRPLLGVGDIDKIEPREVGDRRFLFPGDIALSSFEEELSSNWGPCVDGKERAFLVTSAFWRLLDWGAERVDADLVLVDVGPNLGALNRAALLAADHVVIPLAPDLFSVQGLRNLGPTLLKWRKQWKDRLDKSPLPAERPLPRGEMRAIGYVLLQHGIRAGQPTKAYQQWMDRIPGVYRHDVLGQDGSAIPPIERDEYCLAQIKHYHSLMPMAQEARKPVFALTAADGAFGGHQQAAQRAFDDFRHLTRQILRAVDVAEPRS